PDAQLLLRVPVSVAETRAERRADADRARRKDRYESDRGLQARCAAVYDGLAAGGWLAPWLVLEGGTDDPAALSELAVRFLGE
ncbi:MAG TPA: dTMP kinase, partial [Pseudonocardiaceae bacterium]|nr:dTMP kinase [Pseudonocardiaceae bacterium]